MNYEDLTEAEKLHFENEILKLKLQVEYNAPMMRTSENLPPEIENAFLNNVYNFEKMFDQSKEQSVHQYLGEPSYKPYAELRPEECDQALTDLLDLMERNGIKFHFLDNCYPSSTIYKFITEELFAQIDFLPSEKAFTTEFGGHWNYVYEEFYPNHAYDLRNDTMDFLEILFTEKTISEDFLMYTHQEPLMLNGNKISKNDYLNAIIDFKDRYPLFYFSELNIEKIDFDIDAASATAYCRALAMGKPVAFSVHHCLSYECWRISGLKFELV